MAERILLADLFTVDAGITLVTLTLLEIVLGIDNIVFLAILVGKLPRAQQGQARYIGLSLAMVARVLLLISITWLMKLTKPLFVLPLLSVDMTGKDLILLAGGLFLVAKATHEIHDKLEGNEEEDPSSHQDSSKPVSEPMIIAQIVMIDIIFSLDSVITAVGISNQLLIMIMAVIIAISIMMVFAGAVSDFVNLHPSIKMLALSFLILIGVMLIADSMHQHVPRGYVYFAMFFALAVEILNIRTQDRHPSKPVVLKSPRLKRLAGSSNIAGLFTDEDKYIPSPEATGKKHSRERKHAKVPEKETASASATPSPSE